MKILTFIIVFLMLTGTYSLSQTGGGEAPPSIPPQSQEQPSDYPEYIIRPQEDLDPFGGSTIGGSTTGPDYREGAGTLGTTQKKPSNVEVNRELIEKRKKKLQDQAESEKPEIDYETAYPSGGYEDLRRSAPKTNLYRWTDDDGIMHVTNDLGSVPPEYMEQISNQLEKK